MLNTTRRRVLAFAITLVPVLAFRRAVARAMVVEPVPEAARHPPAAIRWWDALKLHFRLEKRLAQATMRR
jgi:hypothetical protein